MRARASIVAAVGSIAILVLAACSAGGPADVASGTYKALAASSEVGTPPDVSLAVTEASFAFTPSTGEAITATSTPGTTEYVVCPPDTKGIPSPLGAAITLGTTVFQQPAVFGDCGQTSPQRITVVDLASASTDVAPFPFTRWVEFCDTTDPDC